MPFGFKQAPACFQRVMNDLLKDILYEDCTVYLDDIIGWANELEHAERTLDKVCDRMREADLMLNGEKSVFLTKKLEVLGHFVESGTVHPDRSKLGWLAEAECRNLNEVRSLVGALSYFRKFVPKFSQRMRPVLDQLKA